MNTSEKIASIVAQFIAADREEDRKRIAELERDNAVLSEIGHDVVEHLGEVCANYDSFTHSKYFGGQPVPKPLVDAVCISWDATHAVLERHREMYNGHRPHCLLENAETQIADLNKQLDELNEKCAALVVENKRLREDDDEPEGPSMVDFTEMARVLDECGVAKPGRYDNSTLRIDPDMSDPQPGKLLVVRLDKEDVGGRWVDDGDLTENGRGRATQNFWPSQRVGFLVETPAVKRTPQVGDRVRHKEGRIGVLLNTVTTKDSVSISFVDQGGMLFESRIEDLEVIE